MSLARRFKDIFDTIQDVSPLGAAWGGVWFLFGTFYMLSSATSETEDYGVIAASVTQGLIMLLWLFNYFESIYIHQPAARAYQQLYDERKSVVYNRLYAEYFMSADHADFLATYCVAEDHDLESSPLTLTDDYKKEKVIELYKAIKGSPYQQFRYAITTPSNALLNSSGFAIVFLLLAAYNVTSFITEEPLSGTNIFSSFFTLFLLINASYHAYRSHQQHKHALSHPEFLELESTLQLAFDNYSTSPGFGLIQ